MLKSIVALAMLFIATDVSAADPKTISIMAGETVEGAVVSWVKQKDCSSLFKSLDALELLDAPPGISIKFVPGKVKTFNLASGCTGTSDAGTAMIVAADDVQKSDSVITFRAKVITVADERVSTTYQIRLLAFPKR